MYADGFNRKERLPDLRKKTHESVAYLRARDVAAPFSSGSLCVKAISHVRNSQTASKYGRRRAKGNGEGWEGE